ncbi:MAG: undecaprenyl/decaprenyl-phosphate alpha-N-acetylglucosaminyl 1-phosphate transferase [Bacteroidales bacterium]|nr:undecaprenyl/decaprenyl-phosphate alpha-N-acetylglucosaminyl 1-phosphate transferase [Bacteroidales bacterium]MBN2755934.1 undecaprenyl/decaprenyl-phosphate alpha-N-acetylglucosaminyl 1-phosphate transferase [Bacteroidales bacterium]
MFNFNPITSIVLSAITAFAVVYFSIPTIVRVSKIKHLFAEPQERSAHKYSIPNLGGLSIFAGFIISISLWSDSSILKEFQYIIAALIIIFFIGIKDDILITAPLTKFIGQILAATIIVLMSDIRLTNLHGFFGIKEIGYIWSVVLSIFTILVIINGFNFIDGVDGLSASIGIITAGAFGFWFLKSTYYQYVIISISLMSSLFSFFLFNVFGSKNKIFMGDTGSLIIGLILSILVIKFNEFNIDKSKAFTMYPAPAVSFGVLIIPLFDMLRVMFIRFVIGKPIMQADKKHLHHQLLELGLNHIQVTLIISFVNVIFIYFVFYFSNFISIRQLLLLILSVALILSYIPPILILRKKRKEKKTDNTNS